MTKASYTVWINGLLYRLTLLNIPSYIVHTISSYLTCRTFVASFQTATASRRCWGGAGNINLTDPLQSVCQRNAFTLAPRRAGPLRGRYGHHFHVLQADTACQLPESYLNSLQLRLSDWRITINMSKSTTIILARAGQHFIQTRPVILFGELIEKV